MYKKFYDAMLCHSYDHQYLQLYTFVLI